MIVVIRTDASNLIGSGHVMRCLTLADKLRKEGHKVNFICRDLPSNLSQLIIERGYECNLLSFPDELKKSYSTNLPTDDYNIWRGVAQIQDAKQTQSILINKTVDLLIIDHYGIDEKWEKHLRSDVDKIMVIDDLANRKHDCDILLDHNYYHSLESRYDNLVSAKCKKLLGPKHALINPRLREIKENRSRKGKHLVLGQIKNILIFLGGIDQENYTEFVLSKILQENKIQDCLFNVVLGKNNPNKQAIKQKYSKYDNVIFHVQPPYYFHLLEQADLAFGASGVAQVERNYIALPSVVFSVAENQKETYTDSLKENYFLSLETFQQFNFQQLKQLETQLLDSSLIIESNDNIQIKDANIDDAQDIYEWRTHPLVLKVSNSHNTFTYENHKQWFLNKINDSNCVFLVFSNSNGKIGTVRFDINGKSSIVSVFLNPAFFGKKLGTKILSKAITYLFKNFPVTRIDAEILNSNLASKKLFTNQNFTKYKENYYLNKD